MTHNKRIRCLYCGVRFTDKNRQGVIPKYCSAKCRAYMARLRWGGRKKPTAAGPENGRSIDGTSGS